MSSYIEALCMVNLLNELFKRDPVFMTALATVRFPCNESVATHPTVQVRASVGSIELDHQYETGLIGVLNGHFAHQDWNGKLEHYIAGTMSKGVLTGFELVRPDTTNET